MEDPTQLEISGPFPMSYPDAMVTPDPEVGTYPVKYMYPSTTFVCISATVRPAGCVQQTELP